MSCDRGVKRCQAATAAAGLPARVARTTWEQGRKDMAGNAGLNLADMERARLLALREEIDRLLALPPDSQAGEAAGGESVGGKGAAFVDLPPTADERAASSPAGEGESSGSRSSTSSAAPPSAGKGGGDGWIEIKRIHGRAYLYRRWREGGRKRSKYLGPAQGL